MWTESTFFQYMDSFHTLLSILFKKCEGCKTLICLQDSKWTIQYDTDTGGTQETSESKTKRQFSIHSNSGSQNVRNFTPVPQASIPWVKAKMTR